MPTKGRFDNSGCSVTSHFYHRLGTDHVGRDIAAGMIRGTRIALIDRGSDIYGGSNYNRSYTGRSGWFFW